MCEEWRMAVPTEQQFNKCLDLLDRYDLVELAESYWKEPDWTGGLRLIERKREGFNEGSARDRCKNLLSMGQTTIKPDQNEIKAFVTECVALTNKKTDEIYECEAIKWLNSQVGYKMARKSLFGESYNKPIYDSELVDRVTSNIINSIDIDAPEEIKQKRLNRRLQRMIEGNHGIFLSSILKAFKIYFYSDINVYMEKRKQSGGLAEKAKQNIDSLIEIETTLEEYQGRKIEENHDNYRVIRLLKRASLELEDISKDFDMRLKLIEKGNKTAKERLLVFNLWSAFRKYFAYEQKSSTKATAISHLLYIEDIENPITQRAVEKMIQGWRSKSKKIATKKKEDANLISERIKLKKRFRVFM
jgi:hypothetical protein